MTEVKGAINVSWLEPAWFAASAAGVGGASAAVAAFNGVRTLRQARRDSKNRSRPMVTAGLENVPYVRGSQKLVIKNHGPSMARNVRVSFDPPIPDPEPEKARQSVTPFLKRRYAVPIPVMPPGLSLENIYYSGRSVGGQFVNFEPTPDQVVVKISYTDNNGEPYEDEFPLDMMLIRSMTEATSSAAPEAKLKEIATELKRIRELLNKQRQEDHQDTAESTIGEEIMRLMERGDDNEPPKKGELPT
ncbi:hypothetical protein [Amycolatopsis sp. NPDC049868]|uniref:hypothetical protein n=1 Tax=Amycolatopsis sp. NPDC049868 TaxID=3363934 RepID=UPI00378E2EB6